MTPPMRADEEGREPAEMSTAMGLEDLTLHIQINISQPTKLKEVQFDDDCVKWCSAVSAWDGADFLDFKHMKINIKK